MPTGDAPCILPTVITYYQSPQFIVPYEQSLTFTLSPEPHSTLMHTCVVKPDIGAAAHRWESVGLNPKPIM